MKTKKIENNQNIKKLGTKETSKLFGGTPILDWDLRKGAISIK